MAQTDHCVSCRYPSPISVRLTDEMVGKIDEIRGLRMLKGERNVTRTQVIIESLENFLVANHHMLGCIQCGGRHPGTVCPGKEVYDLPGNTQTYERSNMGTQAGNARQQYLQERGTELGWSPEMAGAIEQHLQGFEDTQGRQAVQGVLGQHVPNLTGEQTTTLTDNIFGAIRQGGLGEGAGEGGFGGGQAGGDPLGN